MDILSQLFGPPMPSLSASELNEKLKAEKRIFVLDVREPEEYREGHIAGAKLIPLGELGKRLKDLPHNREIICVCASGSRSRSATKFLIGESYNAVNMNGGMFTWMRSKLPVKKGNAT